MYNKICYKEYVLKKELLMLRGKFCKIMNIKRMNDFLMLKILKGNNELERNWV